MTASDYTFEQQRADCMLLGLRQAATSTRPTVLKKYKEAIQTLGDGDPAPLNAARDRLFSWINNGCPPPIIPAAAQDISYAAKPADEPESENLQQQRYDRLQEEWAKREAVRRPRTEKPAGPSAPLVYPSTRETARASQRRRRRSLWFHFRYRHKRLFRLLVIAIVAAPLIVWLAAPGWINRQTRAVMQNFDGDASLYAGRSFKIGPGELDGRCQFQLNDNRDCARVASLVGLHVYEVLECIYGPSRSGGTYDLRFWHGRVPDDLDSYRIPTETNPLRLVGTGSMDSCPSTLGPAKTVFKATRFPDDPGN